MGENQLLRTIVKPWRIAFLVIATVALVGNLTVPFAIKWSQASDIAGGYFTGLLIGQFATIAIWMLFDTAALHNKIVTGLFVGLVLSCGFVFGVQVWPGMPMLIAIITIIAGTVSPLLHGMFFVGLRSMLGPANIGVHSVTKASVSRIQFGVGFLLLTMAFVAFSILLVRSVMPHDNGIVTARWNVVSVLSWFVWLYLGTSLFVLVIFSSVVKPTLFRVVLSVALVVLGPSVFQMVAYLVLDPASFSLQKIWFEELSYSISFGLITTSFIIGLIMRSSAETNAKRHITSELSTQHSSDLAAADANTEGSNAAFASNSVEV